MIRRNWISDVIVLAFMAGMFSPKAWGAIEPSSAMRRQTKKTIFSAEFTPKGAQSSIQLIFTSDVSAVSQARLVDSSTKICLARCKLQLLERFKNDQQPSVFEFECQSPFFSALRMPLHLQRVRFSDQTKTFLRFGSDLGESENHEVELKKII